MEQPPGPEITQEPLGRLLQELESGTIQVPEFQRDVALKAEWVGHLLASVSLGYPIGAFMLLDAGSPEVRFKTHTIDGAPPSSTQPGRLLVDGQHRMSALYQAIASGRGVIVDDNGAASQRWYYMDISSALDADVDRDEAVLSMAVGHEDEGALERGLFPLRLVFGSDLDRKRWQLEFVQAGPASEGDSRGERLREFEARVLTAFWDYRMPAFRLRQATTRWTVRTRGGAAGPAMSDKFRVPPAVGTREQHRRD